MLKIFYNKLAKLNINFDESYFNKFKASSSNFYDLLQKLKITSFTNEEIKMLNTNKYDFYLKVNTENKGLCWTITTFNYINSLLTTPYSNSDDNKYILSKIKLTMIY